MANAKKQANGKWRCRVYIGEVNGKPKYYSATDVTKRGAELKASEYARTHKADDRMGSSFSEYAKAYIDNRCNIVSPATVRKYNTTLSQLNEKYSWFTDKVAHAITKNDIQKLVNELTLVYAPKSVRTTYGFIIACLKDVNTFNGVILPRIEPKEIEIPLDNEVKKLLKLSKNTCMEIPIMLGSMAMLRRSEISALTLDDVNFETNEITINKAMVMDADGKWIIKPPKTVYSNRTIPVRPEIIALIKEKGTITNLNPNKITEFFAEYCYKANIPDYHFHCLRHYCCSVFAKTCPMSYLKYYGGWGESRTVEQIYTHVKKDEKDSFFNNALSHFDNYMT